MKFKTLCALAAAVLLCACDPGSGTFPDLSLEAYIDGAYSGTFTGGGTDSEPVTYPNTIPLAPDLSFDAVVTIDISEGVWECTLSAADGTLEGDVSGTVNVNYSTDTGYDDYLPQNTSTDFSGTLTGSLADGSDMTMSCPGITMYDNVDKTLSFTGTVTNGEVDGTWEFSDSEIDGTFEGNRE